MHHRLTSVAFPHGNSKAGLAVKHAKRLFQGNVSSNGNLEYLAMTRALLTYRNTPNRGIGFSHAYMLLGRSLRKSLHTRPPLNSANDLYSTWKEIANYRKLALVRRSSKVEKILSEQVKEHAPLEVCD